MNLPIGLVSRSVIKIINIWSLSKSYVYLLKQKLLFNN